ncbi:MAG TPA: EAL domain-containing protein, partial [Candidatus Limnocylindrales bacterium]|nr:EAL domain-containing protein [Candidatus Limnocylindrales bacterium]
VFQPIVALESGATVGFEALTRFTDGRSADEVFAAAVRAEVGLDLELATLRAALSDAVALPRRAFLDVNVSPELVLAGDELATIVASSALDLVLEITEHTEISDYRRFREAVGSLPRTRLAIDDAGAGFASLRHVAELAPASVKLDRSLVHGIDRDPVRRALVTGMVHFADGVGCTLVAEGVETPEERAALLDLGVRFGQGFLLGLPRPVTAFAESCEPVSSGPADEGRIVPIGPRLVAIDGLGSDVGQQQGARRGVTKRVVSGGTIGS